MKLPIYKQPDSMDCGPTCLRMIAGYYGKNIALQTIRDKSQIGKEGVSMLGISGAAEEIGFRAKSLKISYEALMQDARLPAILHWRQNHFVVLYRVKKKKNLYSRSCFGVNQAQCGGIQIAMDKRQ